MGSRDWLLREDLLVKISRGSSGDLSMNMSNMSFAMVAKVRTLYFQRRTACSFFDVNSVVVLDPSFPSRLVLLLVLDVAKGPDWIMLLVLCKPYKGLRWYS